MGKTADQKFCHDCGGVISLRAEICPLCGVRQPITSTMAPAPNQQPQGYAGQGDQKKKTVAALLAIFAGGLGMHKFYTGKPVWGVIYILFCWTFIPAIVGLLEGINFLFMNEKTFNGRYSGPAWSAAT